MTLLLLAAAARPEKADNEITRGQRRRRKDEILSLSLLGERVTHLIAD
jgi:hypothetical protein